MKSSVLLCFVGIVTSANAYTIIRQPDGGVKIKGCHTQIIGNTDYICCDNNCQVKEYWVKMAYSDVEVNYMSDLAERETIDRYTLADVEPVTVEEYDDKTPALGKVQNKINKLGDKVFGVFGL